MGTIAWVWPYAAVMAGAGAIGFFVAALMAINARNKAANDAYQGGMRHGMVMGQCKKTEAEDGQGQAIKVKVEDAGKKAPEDLETAVARFQEKHKVYLVVFKDEKKMFEALQDMAIGRRIKDLNFVPAPPSLN